MNVLVVEPGYLPYEKEVNGLHEMQAVVDGLICEIQPFHDGVALVSNDDAIGMGMEFNRSLPNGFGGIFGTFFLCETDGDRFCSLSPANMEKYKKYFHSAELLIGARGNEIYSLPVAAKPKLTAKPPHEKKHSSPER